MSTTTLDAATLESGKNSPLEINDKTPELREGGTRAWLTVAGSSAALFVTFGWVNCIGLFQAQYEMVQLKDYSSSVVSWIPSMECKSTLRHRFTTMLSISQSFACFSSHPSAEDYSITTAPEFQSSSGPSCTSLA